MPQTYATYTEVLIHALDFNPRSQEVITKKQEIIDSIIHHQNKSPGLVLFYGFSPLIFANSFKQIAVTNITDPIKKYLDAAGIKYTYIDSGDLGQYKKQFNWVVAGEEYFTFAKTEDEQRANIEVLAQLAKDLIVTTLRDYKNQDFRDREFSQPLAVRNGKDSKIFLEYHDHDFTDRNGWMTTVYEMQGTEVKVHGPFARRSMFFKQMAKFSIDAGAKEFYVHKNLMYKSLIKKNYEHVISILF
jgi:hypothetical protein